MKDDLFLLILVVLLIVTLLATPIIWFVKTNVEKNTFNRCTGSHVSFIEAAFTQLRVGDCK